MKTFIDLHQRFTEHFVLSEFLTSPTAEKHGIPNIPLINLPIQITSGYRCEMLNRLVGGVPNSQHVEGLAADIQIPRRHWPFSVTTEEQMARVLWYWMKDNLPDYDQLIIEHRGSSYWVHVSCHINLRMNRHQAFELEKK